MQYELAVVMPVYNEEACVVKVIMDWIHVLSALNIHFTIIILNDGSTDGTARELTAFQHHDPVQVINKTNSGHGPTILMGYQKAVESATWVFQCDSDNEMEARHFPQLWIQREPYGAVFGVRSGRIQNLQRRFISIVSRFIVKLLFGNKVVDVNVPYRLIRAEILKPIIQKIPTETFAPNIIIAGVLSKSKISILNIPIPIQPRQTGSVSIMKWRLWRASLLSFWQIVRLHRIL
jgi:glycosyltransferase involved in cell wall biosynthesis